MKTSTKTGSNSQTARTRGLSVKTGVKAGPYHNLTLKRGTGG